MTVPGVFGKTLRFIADAFTKDITIDPYEYKMIRGIDLYAYVRKEAEQHSNIEWRYATVKSIGNKEVQAIVETDVTFFTTDQVFNSIRFKPLQLTEDDQKKGKHLLLQHFKGWVIETSQPKFNPSSATFMDFSIDQGKGTAFMYFLPTSKHSALVEYTLFTEKLLEESAYENALVDYIQNNLKIDAYTITHEEFGVIPMTNLSFPLQEGRIVHIGVAGGQVKGSSGYAFHSIQKRSDLIIDQLKKEETVLLKKSVLDRKFNFYDSVLLHVLANQKMKGGDIFAAIFKKNQAETIFKFLDNESNLLEDLQIMNSVPTRIFLPVALQELSRSL